MTISAKCFTCKAYILSRGGALTRELVMNWAEAHALTLKHHTYLRVDGDIVASIDGVGGLTLSSKHSGKYSPNAPRET